MQAGPFVGQCRNQRDNGPRIARATQGLDGISLHTRIVQGTNEWLDRPLVADPNKGSRCVYPNRHIVVSECGAIEAQSPVCPVPRGHRRRCVRPPS